MNLEIRQLSDVWEEVLSRLPRSLADICRTSVGVRYRLDGADIITPNTVVHESVGRNIDLIQCTAREITGTEVTIGLYLDKNLIIPEPEMPPEPVESRQPTRGNKSEPKYYLTPQARWTFETFRHGPFNRIAYLTARRLSSLDPKCPSVFMYAPSGSGKSHLAHAVWQEALKKDPRIAYVPAEAFMRHYQRIAPLEGPAGQEEKNRFWKKYQESPLLILEDGQLFFDRNNKWTKSRYALQEILKKRKDSGALTLIISELRG